MREPPDQDLFLARRNDEMPGSSQGAEHRVGVRLLAALPNLRELGRERITQRGVRPCRILTPPLERSQGGSTGSSFANEGPLC